MSQKQYTLDRTHNPNPANLFDSDVIEQIALNRYNARYNNARYSLIKIGANNAHEDYIRYRFHNGRFMEFWQHPEVTELMNLAIDAALEKCGSQHYRGAVLRLVQMGATFDDYTLAAIDRWLEIFGECAS